jgi:7-carboxy-7-deazaguanine synthase
VGGLTVSEVFGPTVQGEGPSAGRRCGFVRLGRCNLDCAWCDTPYTWDWKGKNGTPYDPRLELSNRSVDGVVDQVAALDVPLVVISGGEPLLQRRGLEELVPRLTDKGLDVEIETNGTRPPLDLSHARLGWVRYNVSPKLHSSEVTQERAWIPEAIAALLAVGSVWKFVVGSDHDAADVLTFVRRFEIPDQRVWIMPEGRTATEVGVHTHDAAQLALDHGWNVTTRLQVILWGTERGR